jgi:hypothetical protein
MTPDAEFCTAFLSEILNAGRPEACFCNRPVVNVPSEPEVRRLARTLGQSLQLDEVFRYHSTSDLGAMALCAPGMQAGRQGNMR